MLIIRQLLALDVKISIAGDGDSLLLLKEAFPQADFYALKGIQVSYPEKGPMALWMALKAPLYLKNIRDEHHSLEKLVDTIHPDAVISDNRFGAWSSKVPCVFISHQLRIKAPAGYSWLEPMIYQLNKLHIRNFGTLWTPDHPSDENIAGDLAHHPKAVRELHPHFIGPLSRFANVQSADIPNRYELLILISGLEPQRTIFENLCIAQAEKLNLTTLVIRGKPAEQGSWQQNGIHFVQHLPTPELKAHLEQAKYIVCRSGHSSLMDLAYLKRNALCVATPGQTEQEYLSKYLGAKNYLVAQNQDALNIRNGIDKLQSCDLLPQPDPSLLSLTLDSFLKKLSI